MHASGLQQLRSDGHSAHASQQQLQQQQQGQEEGGQEKGNARGRKHQQQQQQQKRAGGAKAQAEAEKVRLVGTVWILCVDEKIDKKVCLVGTV